MSYIHDLTLAQMRAANTVAVAVPIQNVEALLEELERTDAFGPFFDPFGWLAIRDNIPPHKEVARAFLAYRRVLEKYAVPAPDSTQQMLKGKAG